MKKSKKRTYTDILKDLELIISKLNSKTIPIENSIKLYEEGIKYTNEADKELTKVENNIEKLKKNKKNYSGKINIEKSFEEIEDIMEKLEDNDISINKAEMLYEQALEIIFNIEAYLKKAKSTIQKYEQ
ncbi:MAG: exodeoxyribonuclease VII small subunit [Gammaproteobacteria bacterium]|jgi:exodeoxyribonuclease VII small subunit|nr:exodeoxyribonuclease VII small subunit [Gammaproteobacteria bacterium]MBT7603083.1 exodeoxyribonuclease VII small subunit [Gammaproteobacteria bacterium]